MAKDAVPAYPAHGDRTSGAQRQRREHWQAVLRRWRRSGVDLVEFGRREGINDTTLSWWARKLRMRDCDRVRAKATSAPKQKSKPKAATESAFARVRVIEAAPRENAIAIEIVTRAGYVVRVRPGFDLPALRRTVAALDGLPC